MEVTNIRQGMPEKFDYTTAILDKTQEKKSSESPNLKKSEAVSTSWQKNILMQGLTKLENSIQPAGSHPLDKNASMPIDSFEEALIELNIFRNNMQKDDAYSAQANLKAEDILSLFVDERL